MSRGNDAVHAIFQSRYHLVRTANSIWRYINTPLTSTYRSTRYSMLYNRPVVELRTPVFTDAKAVATRSLPTRETLCHLRTTTNTPCNKEPFGGGWWSSPRRIKQARVSRLLMRALVRQIIKRWMADHNASEGVGP